MTMKKLKATARKELPKREQINPFSKAGKELLDVLDRVDLKVALTSNDIKERTKAVRSLGANKTALQEIVQKSGCPETRYTAEAYLYAFA